MRNVNIKNTREWVRCNEDSRSHHWRNIYIRENDGEFIRKGRYWLWQEKTKKNPSKKKKQLYIIRTPDGEEIISNNLSEFCKERDLDNRAMYRVIMGTRSHHKKYTCKKLIQE